MEEKKIESRWDRLADWWDSRPWYARYPLTVIGVVAGLLALGVALLLFFYLMGVVIDFLGWWSILFFIAVVVAGIAEGIRAKAKAEQERLAKRRTRGY